MSDTTATSSTPAWEQSKENVQPRARGRDPAKLQKVLMERNNREDRSRQLQDTERYGGNRLLYVRGRGGGGIDAVYKRTILN